MRLRWDLLKKPQTEMNIGSKARQVNNPKFCYQNPVPVVCEAQRGESTFESTSSATGSHGLPRDSRRASSETPKSTCCLRESLDQSTCWSTGSHRLPRGSHLPLPSLTDQSEDGEEGSRPLVGGGSCLDHPTLLVDALVRVELGSNLRGTLGSETRPFVVVPLLDVGLDRFRSKLEIPVGALASGFSGSLQPPRRLSSCSLVDLVGDHGVQGGRSSGLAPGDFLAVEQPERVPSSDALRRDSEFAGNRDALVPAGDGILRWSTFGAGVGAHVSSVPKSTSQARRGTSKEKGPTVACKPSSPSSCVASPQSTRRSAVSHVNPSLSRQIPGARAAWGQRPRCSSPCAGAAPLPGTVNPGGNGQAIGDIGLAMGWQWRVLQSPRIHGLWCDQVTDLEEPEPRDLGVSCPAEVSTEPSQGDCGPRFHLEPVDCTDSWTAARCFAGPESPRRRQTPQIPAGNRVGMAWKGRGYSWTRESTSQSPRLRVIRGLSTREGVSKGARSSCAGVGAARPTSGRWTS